MENDALTSHRLTQKVKVLHKVALIHLGKVLLLKRSPDAFSRPGCWDLPGGNAEWPDLQGDSHMGLHRGDIVREIREETGIELTGELFSSQKVSYFETHFDSSSEVYSVIVGWILDLPADFASTITISHEHSEYTWASLSELDEYDFGGYKGKFIKDIILSRVSGRV